MTHKLPEKLSRRSVVLAAVGAATALGVGAAQAGTLPQSAVGYEVKSTHEDKLCSGCKFFMPPNACKTVAGEIAPEGYCKLWAAKPS